MELKNNPSIAPAITNDLETVLLGLEVLQNQTNSISQAQIDAALSVAGLKTAQAQAYATVLLGAFDAACAAATAAGINSVAFLPQFLNAVETAITTGLGLSQSDVKALRRK
jgi:2-methylcitrate dehydratase PrpD